MTEIAKSPKVLVVNDLVLGLVLGYIAGTAGMLVTLWFARLAGTNHEPDIAHVTANGIPAP